MKYIRLTTGLLLAGVSLCAVSFAANAHSKNPKFNIGASVGGIYRTSYPSFIVSTGAAAGTAGTTRHISDSGMVYGILAGADWYYNRVMFGLGANLDWQDADREQHFSLRTGAPVTFNDAHVRYDRGTALGFSGRVGYKVADYVVPYLRAGVQSSRDTLSYRSTQDSGPAAGSTYMASESKRVTNAVLGAGLEIPTFLYNTAFRFEYNYISPKTLNATAPISPAGAGSTAVAYKPTEHQAKLSWVWNFN